MESFISPEERIEEFSRTRKIYETELADHFENLPPQSKSTFRRILVGYLGKLVNVFKLTSEKLRIGSEIWSELSKTEPVITVLNRQLHENETIKELLEVEGNLKTLREIFTKEVYGEIPCTHVVMIQGLEGRLLRAFLRLIGFNTNTILSDPRGEAHAVSLNLGHEMQNPFLGEGSTEDENTFWRRIFPQSYLLAWSWARLHSLVYELETPDGEPVFILPIHIDPKNGVAAIAETIFQKQCPGEKALHYHQTFQEGSENYVGTGLYTLGVLYLIRILEEFSFLFGSITLNVPEDIDSYTRHSILGDDETRRRIEKILNQS